MAASPARDAIIARTLALPPDLQDAGTLTWQGVAEVTEELRLPQDGLLLDIVCGRSGYGIEVARRAVDHALTRQRDRIQRISSKRHQGPFREQGHGQPCSSQEGAVGPDQQRESSNRALTGDQALDTWRR